MSTLDIIPYPVTTPNTKNLRASTLLHPLITTVPIASGSFRSTSGNSCAATDSLVAFPTRSRNGKSFMVIDHLSTSGKLPSNHPQILTTSTILDLEFSPFQIGDTPLLATSAVDGAINLWEIQQSFYSTNTDESQLQTSSISSSSVESEESSTEPILNLQSKSKKRRKKYFDKKST